MLNASHIFQSESSVGLFERLPCFTFYWGSDLKTSCIKRHINVR